MAECKTIKFLQVVDATKADLSIFAKSAIGIINDTNSKDVDPITVDCLHELIGHIYKETRVPLLAHLQDGADCSVCSALVTKLT